MIDKSPANPLPKITSLFAKDEPTTYPGCSIKSFDGNRTITLEIHKLTDKTIPYRGQLGFFKVTLP